ncbi:MAG: HAMP domain-containing sensor histidine kinase [Actinomycetota bacterium]|nr:HAMP domain-containing sensor histidine kinase [Actinomycetota bacterium]
MSEEAGSKWRRWLGRRRLPLGTSNPKQSGAKSSLKSKLVLTVALLVMAGLAVADIATYTSLRSFLYQRLDAQLQSSMGPTARVLFNSYNGVDSGRGLAAMVPNGSWGELVSPAGARFSVTFVQPGQVAVSPPQLNIGNANSVNYPLDKPFSVDSIDSTLHYRAMMTRIATGNLLVVLAIPETSVEATLARLAVVTALVSFGLLLVLIWLASYLIGLGLAPLGRMTRTAEEIAAGDFTKRVETEAKDLEVERLALSLNTMLGALQGAIEEREASETRLKRFVADASHELRTPLTSIRGYAELIETGLVAKESEVHGAAERITSEARRMAGLVEDLLILARNDQARPLARRRVDYSAIVEAAVADARVVEPERTIESDIVPHLEVVGDEARLTQVIANLLANVRAHTARGTWAKVTLRPLPGEGGALAKVMLEVEDRGPGMTPDQLAHAFERFYRADASRTRAQGGAGLGLSLVASIAEAHGGKAWITSAGPGLGTTVYVELPASGPPEPAASAKSGAAAGPPGTTPEQGPDRGSDTGQATQGSSHEAAGQS